MKQVIRNPKLYDYLKSPKEHVDPWFQTLASTQDLEDFNKQILEERIHSKIQPYLNGSISSDDFLNSLDKDEYVYFSNMKDIDLSIFSNLNIHNPAISNE